MKHSCGEGELHRRTIILQKMIIPDKASEMYIRGGEISFGRIALKKGEKLTLDTYFNAFCFTKYRQYTSVENVSFGISANGSLAIKLMLFDGANEYCVTKGEGSLSAKLSELPENGILYPEITAIDDCTIMGGEFFSECTPNDISVCVAICTYKREEYVLRNINLLRSYNFSYIDKVFVSDNGQTLDCAALSDEFVSVLPNKNYGGSGGFTRGLIEANDGGFSHIILMDDDVSFHPETLEQMTVFVSLLKNAYINCWFSTGMLPLDQPWVQYELGAEWDGKKAIVHKHNVDIRDRHILCDNLINPDVGYGGWWTLLMPVSVTKNGLPYPFFIKFDDVEYGLRKPQDTEIITMNGIAVCHEAFDAKKNFVLDYYNLRNELTVNALYGKYGSFGAAKRFLYEVAKDLCLYRYDVIPLALKAAKDFLSGADFFLETDEELLNRELIEAAPKMKKLSDIPQWNEEMRCDKHKLDKRVSAIMLLTLGGHIIPSFLLKRQVNAVPLSGTGAKDCFLRKAVIQYQPGSDRGLLTKRSLAKFLKYGVLGCLTALRILLGFNRVKKELPVSKGKITSFDFWRAHLGISQE